ncbi:MAG: hydroxymethylbilane synthase [Phycisphaerae bacterium]|nr:hydroxymethylbilane synthase [Phycisphaerae bacterium]
MRPSRRDIVIATRKSRLARAQSDLIGRWLLQLNPRVQMRLVEMESEGDRLSSHPLTDLGGKGLFTRTIEAALLGRRADLAVHSFKDLPTTETAGLVVAATPPREAVHDVLIARGPARIEDLPRGATVGTCSPRRGAQLLRLRSDLKIVPMRGNVETRLTKVLEQQIVDATLLAAAGLVRLGLDQHTRCPIPVEQVLPAAGQAALAVQCRLDDHPTLRRCMPINDPPAALAVSLERQVIAATGADCHSPIAVLAETQADATVRLRVRILSMDGRTCLEEDRTSAPTGAAQACGEIIESLLSAGARELIQRVGPPA